MNFESWLSKKVGAALARLVMFKEKKNIQIINIKNEARVSTTKPINIKMIGEYYIAFMANSIT